MSILFFVRDEGRRVILNMIAAPKGSGVDSMYPTIVMLAVGLEPTPLALREGRPNTIRLPVRRFPDDDGS